MNQKWVTTCYWSQVILKIQTYVNRVWKQTLVNPYNIMVYMECLLDQCNINVLATSGWLRHWHLHVFKWNFYQLLTHSAWLHHSLKVGQSMERKYELFLCNLFSVIFALYHYAVIVTDGSSKCPCLFECQWPVWCWVQNCSIM